MSETTRVVSAELKAIVEALIFASPDPLTPKMLYRLLADEPKEDVKATVEALKADYESRPGLQFVEVAGGYQIVTRPELHEWVRRLFHERSAQKLTVQGLETLAVIAYKQPITALEIGEIRGVKEYVYPVGRLDYDTQGLLLLTNDGDLAAKLTHPRHEVDRTYEARVAGMPDDEAVERLRRGIPLDGRRTLPADVLLINKGRRDEDSVLLVTIREGRNRQVRRMLEAVGHPVQSLRRIRFGPISDRRLKPGDWRELSADEVEKLKKWKSGKVSRK